MLVNFRIENYKSFKEFTEFSMQATKLKNLKESNSFDINNISLLKSAVVYGANASGKSNLLNAMKDMKKIILSSLNLQKEYKHKPFLLNTDTEEKPTIFELEFIIEKILYRYGFEIRKDATILEEWLHQKKMEPRAKETVLFKRVKQDITISAKFKEGKSLESKTREDALFLSVVAEFNGEVSLSIIEWVENFMILFSLNDNEFKFISYLALDYTDMQKNIINFINSSDVGISTLTTKESSFDELTKISLNENGLDSKLTKKFSKALKKSIEEIEGKKIEEKDIPKKIQTQHMMYNKENKFQTYKTFDLDMESAGTQRLLSFSGPILMTLDMGRVLVIDELDNSLHPDLVKAIIKLFNSKETNPKNAQLIFTTHDTNLLDQSLFRRDQIWFTEKDIYGATDLYSLVEYGKGKTRDDLALEKNYLDGKFGATPNIGSLVTEAD